MADATAHLDAFLDAARRAYAGTGVIVRSVDELPRTTTGLAAMAAAIQRRSIPSSVVQATLSVRCWGAALEAVEKRLSVRMDLAKEPAVAAQETVDRLMPSIIRQQRLRDEAHSVGIEAPLTGNALLSTAHLLVDPDAVSSLVDHLGGCGQARRWLEDQMHRHVQGLQNQPDADPIVRIVGAHLHVPFVLSPLRPARGTGGTRPGHVWEHDTVYLSGRLPESAMEAAAGRPFSALVSGTPIGHRIVEGSVIDDGIAVDPAGQTVVILKTPVEPVDGLLPPRRK